MSIWLSWRRVLGGEEKVFHLTESLFLRRNLPELLPGSLDNSVSNDVVSFNGRSWEDVSSEFEGMAGRSCKMEGSSVFF